MSIETPKSEDQTMTTQTLKLNVKTGEKDGKNFWDRYGVLFVNTDDGPEGRESLENGAGLKLYITPRDERTVKEVSASVGKTTREAVTSSFGRSKGFFGAQSTTSRLEERPLLSETEARFMDPDDVIILASPQHPIKARRIKYFEDPTFSGMMDAQEGRELPYPPPQRLAAEGSGRKATSGGVSKDQPDAVDGPSAEVPPIPRQRPSRKLKLDTRNNPMNLAHWDASDTRASVFWPDRYDPGPV
jgi:Type IV secretory system Conjugative DNA transfer